MNEWIAVAGITLLAVISPGPDFAMVTRNSLMLSRRAGMLTALGIGLGTLVHVGYAILGLGLLISQSLWLFGLIKFAGALYLIWLGLKMLRAKPAAALEPGHIVPLSPIAALRTGLLTNVLNPKATVFIVSLFTQVVQPATPLLVQAEYGLFIALAHVAWFALVAGFFSAGAIRGRLLAVRHWIDRIFGGLLVGFGIALASSRATR